MSYYGGYYGFNSYPSYNCRGYGGYGGYSSYYPQTWSSGYYDSSGWGGHHSHDAWNHCGGLRYSHPFSGYGTGFAARSGLAAGLQNGLFGRMYPHFGQIRGGSMPSEANNEPEPENEAAPPEYSDELCVSCRERPVSSENSAPDLRLCEACYQASRAAEKEFNN